MKAMIATRAANAMGSVVSNATIARVSPGMYSTEKSR